MTKSPGGLGSACTEPCQIALNALAVVIVLPREDIEAVKEGVLNTAA